MNFPAETPRHPASVASALHVDLATTTGPVRRRATGMLYGLGDPGVPAPAIIEGAGTRVIAQKAPGGNQHPNGDALVVAEGFFAAGGEEIQVYLQDLYTEWPYEQLGIEDYVGRAIPILEWIARSPEADRMLIVPFNEPDWIWYGDWEADRERFLDDWKTLHRAIRAILPATRIVGPNELTFNEIRVRDFLEFALAHAVMPDLLSWHELVPSGLRDYEKHFRRYRQIEQEIGVEPLPVSINEYGNRRDMSNPGRLIQWIAAFENTKVDACLAYWTFAGNLNDHAVRATEANGAWWLLEWYAGLTGSTVAVTNPGEGTLDGLRAVAVRDLQRGEATVLFGGTSDDVALTITGLDAHTFGPRPEIEVRATTWTGPEGTAARPRPLLRTLVEPVDGVATILVPGGDPMAAYRLTITAPEGSGAPSVSWDQRREAEESVSRGFEVSDRQADPQFYAASGGSVIRETADDSSVTVTFDVPEDGEYVLGAYYATDGGPALRELRVDGMPMPARPFPATLNLGFMGRLDTRLHLVAGSVKIEFTSIVDRGTRMGAAMAFDRFDLARSTPGDEVAGARDARLSARATLELGTQRPPRIRLVDGTATWFLAVAGNGFYRLAVEGSGDGPLDIIVGDHSIQRLAPSGSRSTSSFWRSEAVLYLAAGVHAIRASGGTHGRPVMIDSLSLSREASADSSIVVTRAGAGSSDEPLLIDRGPRAGNGVHVATIAYSNAAKNDADNYNTDVISLQGEILEDGRPVGSAFFAHNYAWDNVWTRSIAIDLATRDSRVLFQGGAPGPRIAWISLAPLVVEAGLRML